MPSILSEQKEYCNISSPCREMTIEEILRELRNVVVALQ